MRAHDQATCKAGGTVLVITMVLLTVMTVLGITGLVTAALELQMSGNVQYQERAFQAAEFAIEQAIHVATLSTADSLTVPARVPAGGGDVAVPGSAIDTYNYRLYYDSSAGATPVPGGSEPGEIHRAYHFVIEGTGNSARGASSTVTQGFYVLAPAACGETGSSCDFATGLRRRTYWIQQGTE